MTRRKPSAKDGTSSGDESGLYDRIRALVVSARQRVARGVDLVQVVTNFEIGRHIVENEQRGEDRAGYGKQVLGTLSDRLSGEFGQGFSVSNLKLMRQFFLLFRNRSEQIGQTMSGQFERPKGLTTSGFLTSPTDPPAFSLSWSHYVFLIGVKNTAERNFYEIESFRQNWTLRELKRQFDTSLYERLSLSRDREGVRRLAFEGQIVNDPKDLLKEPVVLEFLGLSEQARYTFPARKNCSESCRNGPTKWN